MKVKNLITGRFERDKHLKRYKNCEICKEKFFCRSLFKYQTGKYCSRKCQAEAFSIKKVGKRPYQMTDKTRKAISEAKKGIPIWGSGRKCTWMKGENNPNWKGGFSNLHDQIKWTQEWKKWRQGVFDRDEYTCQLCFKRGVFLHPHHIKSMTDFIEDRFNIDNGVAICRECHYLIHSNDMLKQNGWYIRKEVVSYGHHN